MMTELIALGVEATAAVVDSTKAKAVIALASGFTLTAWKNGYGRDKEDQADRVGLRYAHEAGYDVRVGPPLWNRFAGRYGESNVVANFFFGDHSRALDRASNLQREIALNYADTEGPRQSERSSMSSRYEPNCVGDVFNGGRWNGEQNGSDWLQRDFGSPRSVSEIRIKTAGTDVTTSGARIVLKLQTPNGQWVTVDELRDTNINIFTPLTGGATGNSMPSYRKILATPVTAQAFRIEFTGNGWFVAEDIQVVF